MKNINGVEILESLDEIVRPAHSSLVLWDVQNGLVDRIFNREEFLTNLRRLAESLRGMIPLFYTLHTPLPPELRSGWNYGSMMRRFGVSDPAKLPVFMAPGTKDREIPDAISPRPGDVQFEKATPNIFLGTNFETMLRNRGIQTVIFTGIATEMGVEHSVRDAAARGFYPVVVTDCVSTMDPEAHQRSLTTMNRLAVTATSKEVIQATHPASGLSKKP